jgi:O-antigen ligase
MPPRLPCARRHPDHAARRSHDRGIATASRDVFAGPLTLGAAPTDALAGQRVGDVLDRAQAALLAALAATSMLSVFATQLFLGLATLVWALRLLTRRARLTRMPLDGPVLAFIVWTLLSASFSPNPGESFRTGGKKLVLFAVAFVAVDVLRRERERERVLDALTLGAIVLGVGAITQYHFLGYDTLNHRPTSFLGHWMTASGLSMGALVLCVARLAFRRQPLVRPAREDLVRLGVLAAALAGFVILQKLDTFAVEGERMIVTALAVPISAWALVVGQTRSAWIGALVGLAIVAIARAPRLLWGLAGAVALLLIARPAPLMSRLTIRDVSSVDRYYMWQAGVDMVRDKPVFGQGPGIIPSAYPRFRWAEAPNPAVSHLHNNALQFAAERGLPCAAIWLWLVTLPMGRAYREWRRGAWDARWIAVGALGFLAAILVAGMFEYNFGDSEVLYVILLMCVVPFTLAPRQEALPA